MPAISLSNPSLRLYRTRLSSIPFRSPRFSETLISPRGWRKRRTLVAYTAQLSAAEEEWLKKLPDRKKPLYSHSLPCIEAWLRQLGFYQSRNDRAVWIIEKSDWHAQLSLDVTDLYIRYQQRGPGSLAKDVERKFSYALSREDLENAILGGP